MQSWSKIFVQINVSLPWAIKYKPTLRFYRNIFGQSRKRKHYLEDTASLIDFMKCGDTQSILGSLIRDHWINIPLKITLDI